MDIDIAALERRGISLFERRRTVFSCSQVTLKSSQGLVYPYLHLYIVTNRVLEIVWACGRLVIIY